MSKEEEAEEARRRRVEKRQADRQADRQARNALLKPAGAEAADKDTAGKGDSPRRETGKQLTARTNAKVARRGPVPSVPAAVTPRPWPGAVQPLQFLIEARRARRRGFRWRLALFCGLPTLLVFCYVTFVASSRYISEFEITYQTFQPQTTMTTTGLVQSLLGSSPASSVDFSSLIYEYIRSAALLKKLDTQLHLRQYYSSPNVDYLSRMDPHASLDVLLTYYLWYVSVSEGEGGYLTVDVQAFDPAYALAVSRAIIKATDDMVNQLTTRARDDEVRFAKSQVSEEETRYRKARLALTQFQNVHGDLNPQNSAGQLGGIVGTIEGQLAAQRTYLASIKALGPASPQVKVIETKIASLEQQLKDEQKRLATHSSSDNTPYSVLLDQYASLQIEQQFAQTAYQAAQQNLVVAEANAVSQQNYVVDFVPPHLPDRAGLYFILEYTLTTLIISLVLFGAISLLSGAMRDRAEI